MNVIELKQAEEKSGWNSYVQNHPDAVLYHDSRWRDFMIRVYGLETLYLMAEEGGRITGILPIGITRGLLTGKRATSLPYHMYGGVSAENPESGRALIERAGALLRDRGIPLLEMRQTEYIAPDFPSHSHKITMVLDLPEDPEELWQSLNAKVRNQVRKAEKSGLSVRENEEGAIEDFYQVMVRNMRDLGSPIHSRAFFQTAVDLFPEAARVFTVRKDRECLAAGITFDWRGHVELPWASSLREYNNLCPNTLLYWVILQKACERGMDLFDFGRCTRNSGTHQFKRQWGGREIPLAYQYWRAGEHVELPGEAPGKLMETASRIWRILPHGVTRILGPRLVRGIP